MIIVGAAGCFLVFVVAAAAVTATFTKSGVYIWSSCSGCLTLVFGAVGAVFIFMALLFTIDLGFSDADVLRDCKAHLMNSTSPVDATMECGMDAYCDVVNFFKNKAQVIGFGLGIPFFVSGGMMYIGCWACCCCKSHFVDESPSLDEAKAEDAPLDSLKADTVTVKGLPLD